MDDYVVGVVDEHGKRRWAPATSGNQAAPNSSANIPLAQATSSSRGCRIVMLCFTACWMRAVAACKR